MLGCAAAKRTAAQSTTFFWQIVLAGARKAGRELNVNVPELGVQSESDINGQISILENAVSDKPAAIVIALIADKIADGQRTTGLNIMTDLITANPNLRGVFTSNLTMTQGAGQAIC